MNSIIDETNPLYVCFLRAKKAHANITDIDLKSALKIKGVVKIYTGQDLAKTNLDALVCCWQSPQKNLIKKPTYPILALNKAHYMGQPICAVIAEKPDIAKQACDAIIVDFDDLPPLIDMRQALNAKSFLHPEIPHNLCFEWMLGDEISIDKIFQNADYTTSLNFKHPRFIPHLLKQRLAIGQYDTKNDHYMLTTTSAQPHVLRSLIANFVLNIAEDKLRVKTADLNGDGAPQINIGSEEILVLWASAQLKKTIQWSAQDTEKAIINLHIGDHLSKIDLALDHSGRFLAVRADILSNMGAYLATFSPITPILSHLGPLTGQYHIPNVFCRIKGVFTNTVPTGVCYENPSAPTASLTEMIIHQAGDEMGIDPLEIRKLNVIQTHQFPYQTATGIEYHQSDYVDLIDQAVNLQKLKKIQARNKKSQSQDRLRGIGMATYVKACLLTPQFLKQHITSHFKPYETARITIDHKAHIKIYIALSLSLQHQHIILQAIHKRFLLNIKHIEILHGDSDYAPPSTALHYAAPLWVSLATILSTIEQSMDKICRMSANLFDVKEQPIIFNDGVFKLNNSGQSKTFEQLIHALNESNQSELTKKRYIMEDTVFYAPPTSLLVAGADLCEIEIDINSGLVFVVRVSHIDDGCYPISSAMANNQIQSKLTHDINQTLFEHVYYNDQAHCIVESYHLDANIYHANPIHFNVKNNADYFEEAQQPMHLMPSTTSGYSPALINAVSETLKLYGIKSLNPPFTPFKIWQAIQS
ncbi:MAG: molybdopterin cofactor-binding domain-containing protein [Pseudomonadota bacterium]